MSDTMTTTSNGLQRWLNQLARPALATVRGPLPAAPARARLLGGTIRTLRGTRPITGAESTAPTA